MYPPPQPTGKMVAGTCEANIIEEKSVLVVYYIGTYLNTHHFRRVPVYPLIHGLLRTHFSAPTL